MKKEHAIVKREVSVSGHCLRAGDDALTRAKAFEPEYAGWQTANTMCAVTMWTFALEADVNHLLQRLYEEFPEDKQNEVLALDKAYWLTLKERIELFCEWIGASRPDFGKRPFQVVSILKKVRDAVAHGKPYLEGQEKVRLAEDGTIPVLPRALMANWELECTLERAARYREDVMNVHNVLTEMSGMQLGNPLEMTSVVSW